MARQKRRAHGTYEGIIEPRYSIWVVTTIVAAFLVLIGFFVTSAKRFAMSNAAHATSQSFSNPHDIPLDVLSKLDAILVLGGGAPESLTEPPIYVQKRADDAATVIHLHNELIMKNDPKASPLSILCLSAGTAHLPQILGPNGLPIWESTACAAYLARNHGLSKNVYVETTSYDTIGNAFYARASHTDVNGWRRLLVITSEFHMNRTAAIFDWIFLDCSAVHQPNRRNTVPYELYYLSSPNVGLTEDAIAARKERETQSAKNIQENLARKYKTLPDVWKFLNSDHALYSADKLIQRGQGTLVDPTASDLVKKSYGLKAGG